MNPMFDRLMKAAQKTQFSPEFGSSLEKLRRKVYAGQEPQYGSSMPDVVREALSPFAKDMDRFVSGQPRMSPSLPEDTMLNSPPIGVETAQQEVKPIPGGGMKAVQEKRFVGMSPLLGSDQGDGINEEDRLHDTGRMGGSLKTPVGRDAEPVQIPEGQQALFGLKRPAPAMKSQQFYSESPQRESGTSAPESIDNALLAGTDISGGMDWTSPTQDINRARRKYLDAARNILGPLSMVSNPERVIDNYLMPMYSKGEMPDPNSPEFRNWVWQQVYDPETTGKSTPAPTQPQQPRPNPRGQALSSPLMDYQSAAEKIAGRPLEQDEVQRVADYVGSEGSFFDPMPEVGDPYFSTWVKKNILTPDVVRNKLRPLVEATGIYNTQGPSGYSSSDAFSNSPFNKIFGNR